MLGSEESWMSIWELPKVGIGHFSCAAHVRSVWAKTQLAWESVMPKLICLKENVEWGKRESKARCWDQVSLHLKKLKLIREWSWKEACGKKEASHSQ